MATDPKKPNELVVAPTLPWLLPDADLARTLRDLAPMIEGNDVYLTRMPTTVEREVMSKRLREIDPVLAPFGQCPLSFEEGGRNISAKEKIKRALGAFFLGYPSTQSADGPALITAYMMDLQALPVFAILRALDDIKRGKVTTRDRRGNEIPLDKDWPPSSPRVYDVAVKAMHDLVTEQITIRRVMTAKKLSRPQLTDDERAQVSAKIKRMAAEAKEKILPVDMRAADREESDRRAAMRQAKLRERQEAEFRQQYTEYGVEPVFVGDTMMSPDLAYRTNPALFDVRKGPRR